MTILDDIIADSTNDAVSTSNLLRKVQVVAHRVQATELLQWVRQELNGYDSVDGLPEYRAALPVNVLGTWSMPGRLMKQALSSGTIPDEARDALFRINMNQSLAELEEFMNAPDDKELGYPWDQMQVLIYNKWVKEGKAPGLMYASVLEANRLISKGMLRGVIDAVRNTALNFALELQSADPNAGTVGGPTVADAAVGGSVRSVTYNIFGDGAQVAMGNHIAQHSTVQKGDLAGLLKAVAEVGLLREGSNELAKILLGEEQDRSSRIKGFLRGIGSGAIAVATGATGQLVADAVEPLVQAYLGA